MKKTSINEKYEYIESDDGVRGKLRNRVNGKTALIKDESTKNYCTVDIKGFMLVGKSHITSSRRIVDYIEIYDGELNKLYKTDTKSVGERFQAYNILGMNKVEILMTRKTRDAGETKVVKVFDMISRRFVG